MRTGRCPGHRGDAVSWGDNRAELLTVQTLQDAQEGNCVIQLVR